ncbi:cytochrome P450 [Roridomyces roridus]|uniref:Cytochrome P450 n=1 Tax=Roridomyces roridus TaxID=1738132 RepID=A0AAD7FKA0_9AGAR|nr:cytochrome P450 [Roridomyces roridus]
MSPALALATIYGQLQLRHISYLVTGYALYISFYRLVLYPRFFSPLRNIPGPPLGNPLLGQFLPWLRGEPCIPQREWAKQYGTTVRAMTLFGVERMIYLSPDALHQILVKGWHENPRPPFLRGVLGLMAGHGLLTAIGEDHKRLRKAMNPAFSVQSIMAQTHMYYEPIEGLVELLNEHLEDSPAGKVLPIYEWMGKVTLDIICDTAFGYKPDCLHHPDNELAVAFEELLGLQSGSDIILLACLTSIPGAARLLSSDWVVRHRKWLGRIPLPISMFSKLETLLDSTHRIRNISRQMLREKMAAPDDTSTKKDIMSLLVRAALDADSADEAMIDDRAMVDQVLTFLAAGHETAATGISWALWLLANDQESQGRLREEVTPVFQDSPRPDYRALKSLEFLDCVVNESTRLFPPIAHTSRVTTKDDYVEGVLLPKGTLVNIPIRAISTQKRLWGEDAEEFRPTRWLNLPDTYDATYSNFSFLVGPHSCIGKTMAVNEMRAVLAAVIANFEFAPAYEGQRAHPAMAVTLKPEDNVPLLVKRVRR